jgi:hypothetical protein
VLIPDKSKKLKELEEGLIGTSIEKDVEYSYAFVSSDLTSNNIRNDYYTMPFFQTEKGLEIGISHLFTVNLKSSSDFAALDSIAKANSVKIVGNHTFRPLWYFIVRYECKWKCFTDGQYFL